MDDKVTIGIHSAVSGDAQGSFNQFVDGHAWISVTRNGQTEYYGLWPDNHPRIQDNGDGTDIRKGMEASFTPDASRYYTLAPEQAAKLEAALEENVTWRYTNTCASWASETVERVTGRSMNADDTLGFETPRKLIETIRAQEREQPTSSGTPLPANTPTPRSSSFGALNESPAAAGQGIESQLAALINDPQRLQDWNNRVAAHRQEISSQERRLEPTQEPPVEPAQIAMSRG